MNSLLDPRLIRTDQFCRSAEYLLSCQRPDGRIQWFSDGKTDPWDCVEAAMGLSIVGEIAAAERAYTWLCSSQLSEGSWLAAYYEPGAPAETVTHKETNFIAYIATGIWHHYLISGKKLFLEKHFPVVQKAIDFVLRYQSNDGEIYWAVDECNVAQEDALITGCSSIFKSLSCAIQIARALKVDKRIWQKWLHARKQLGEAIRHKPERFDRTWESKKRFSMDWFYPILTGVVTGPLAVSRINQRWEEFVEPGLGCRCVSDEPWVTVAESCELVLALTAIGKRDQAMEIYTNLQRWRDEDGGYWTGYNFRDDVIWPKQKTTWTLGAVLLAADALFQYSPAWELFVNHVDFQPAADEREVAEAGSPLNEDLFA